MKFKSIATAAVAAALLGPVAGWAAMISVLPASLSVGQGASFSVTVRISGLSGEIASAFDLGISYNTSLLTYGGATFLAGSEFGSGLSSPTLCPSTPNYCFDDTSSTPGNVDAIGYSLLTDDSVLQGLQGGAFDLFKLNFTAASVDNAAYLNFSSLANYYPDVTGLGGKSLSLQLNGACVAIGAGTCGGQQPIPEPASYALVALAIGAAGLAGRSRKRTATSADAA